MIAEIILALAAAGGVADENATAQDARCAMTLQVKSMLTQDESAQRNYKTIRMFFIGRISGRGDIGILRQSLMDASSNILPDQLNSITETCLKTFEVAKDALADG